MYVEYKIYIYDFIQHTCLPLSLHPSVSAAVRCTAILRTVCRVYRVSLIVYCTAVWRLPYYDTYDASAVCGSTQNRTVSSRQYVLWMTASTRILNRDLIQLVRVPGAVLVHTKL